MDKKRSAYAAVLVLAIVALMIMTTGCVTESSYGPQVPVKVYSKYFQKGVVALTQSACGCPYGSV